MTVKTKGPNPVDVHVGRRVRIRRVLVGHSQTKLAEQLGLTFQQLQKYESGANRISASKLWLLSQLLDVPVAWFFAGLEDGAESAAPDEISTKRETLELCRNVAALPASVQKQMRLLIKELAGRHVPQPELAAAE